VYKGLDDHEANILLVERVESIISADITRATSENKVEPDPLDEKAAAEKAAAEEKDTAEKI